MLSIEIFDRERHDRGDFDCGVQKLNDYLQDLAFQDDDRGLAKIYVLVDGTKIRGYYTLTALSIDLKSLPPDIETGKFKKTKYKKIKYENVPFLLLGRLAIDKRLQGQRYGRILLCDACKTAKDVAERVGLLGIIVDAKDENAAAFYRKFGFISIEGKKNRLVLPLASFQYS